MSKKRAKKKAHKTSDPHYEVHTYGQGKNPFNIEWFKYFNAVEGRDQVLFLYTDKNSGEVCKYRFLR
jgi:hypothetical protein